MKNISWGYNNMSEKEIKISIDKKTSAFAELKDYCYLSGDDDYIEVTEWRNQEGYDVCVSSKLGERSISMTCGEIDLLNVLVKSI